MKRVLTTVAVTSAAFGMLVAGAGTASAQDPYAKVVGPPITSEPYGLGIAKTHTEFVQFVNSVLEDVRANGTWRQWYVKWLKPTVPAPEPPPAKYGRAL